MTTEMAIFGEAPLPFWGRRLRTGWIWWRERRQTMPNAVTNKSHRRTGGSDKRQHDNHPYDRPRRQAMRHTNRTRGVQRKAALGGIATRGRGGGARQSDNQPNKSGAAKGGGGMNGGSQCAGRRCDKREWLRHKKTQQPTEREGWGERWKCDDR